MSTLETIVKHEALTTSFTTARSRQAKLEQPSLSERKADAQRQMATDPAEKKAANRLWREVRGQRLARMQRDAFGRKSKGRIVVKRLTDMEGGTEAACPKCSVMRT